MILFYRKKRSWPHQRFASRLPVPVPRWPRVRPCPPRRAQLLWRCALASVCRREKTDERLIDCESVKLEVPRRNSVSELRLFATRRSCQRCAAVLDRSSASSCSRVMLTRRAHGQTRTFCACRAQSSRRMTRSSRRWHGRSPPIFGQRDTRSLKTRTWAWAHIQAATTPSTSHFPMIRALHCKKRAKSGQVSA